MKTILTFVSCTLLLSACEPPLEDTYGTVTDVRVLTAVLIDKQQGNPVGGAIVGALFGGAIGMPTAGAIVGAAAESGREEALVLKEVSGCRLEVQIDGKRLVFTPSWNLNSCALFKSGDPIPLLRVTKRNGEVSYFWEHERADVLP